jgi:hydroxymethylpyrimidine pyrophosphatase-like HAD family hydrolase
MTARTAPRLVALDFDLTIYDHANPRETRRLLPLFEQLRARGVMAGCASGRSIAELRQPLEEIGFAWASPFPSFAVCSEGEIRRPDGADWPGAEGWNRDRREKVDRANAVLRPLFDEMVAWASARGIGLARGVVADASGINVAFDDPPAAEKVLAEFSPRIAALGPWHASRNHHLVLARPHGTHKGHALARFAEILGLRPAEILAIGDNLNDRCMLLEGPGFLAATVANAVPEIREGVRAAGGYVAASPFALGVEEALRHAFSLPPT